MEPTTAFSLAVDVRRFLPDDMPLFARRHRLIASIKPIKDKLDIKEKEEKRKRLKVEDEAEMRLVASHGCHRFQYREGTPKRPLCRET